MDMKLRSVPSAVCYLHVRHLASVCVFPPVGHWSGLVLFAQLSVSNITFPVAHFEAKKRDDTVDVKMLYTVVLFGPWN